MSKTSFSGLDIKLIRSDILPSQTMVVSPDLYDLLANDGETAKKAHAEFLSKAQAFTDLIKSTAP